MTRRKFDEVDCPKCGSKQTVTILESINATLNPDLKEKLLQGKINIFQCQKCGEEAFIPIPLLYHDISKEFCIQFYPFDMLQDDESLKNFTKEGNLNILFPILESADYMKNTHIVFEMGELVRHVMFRDILYEKWGKVAGKETQEASTDERAAILIMSGVQELVEAAMLNPALDSAVRQAISIIQEAVARLAGGNRF